MKIHYDLIGTHPSLDSMRYSLDEVILRYEQSRPEKVDVRSMNDAERQKYLKSVLFADPNIKGAAERMQRLADGLVIEMAAQHFYGLSGEDFNSVGELITAMQTMENK